jgi:hypothetical protein
MRAFSVSKGLKIAYEGPAKSVDRKAKSPNVQASVSLLGKMWSDWSDIAKRVGKLR